MNPATTPDPCVLVIFGASGDLTRRKLIPSLYDLDRRGQLPKGMQVLGVSRTPMTDEQFRDAMAKAAKELGAGSGGGGSGAGGGRGGGGGAFDAAAWARFATRLHYFAGDAVKPEIVGPLSERINAVGSEAGIARAQGTPNILFYLSVSPELYEPIIGTIGISGLVTEGKRWCSLNPGETAWQRIIIEKPFGTDLHSARSLNMALGRVFEEEAIFRIDHYLGKELVQNILVMRCANTIFEPVWNRRYVDHVQVTAAETLGVGSRAGSFYDKAGALRDMVQSHLLQVLALVAIEPPSVFDAEAIMREKIKLFNTAAVATPEEAPSHGAFGRYGPGPNGEPAYEKETGVDPARRTETFAAIKVEFENWRWAGVPFYIRSGKMLAKKLTEVVIQFKRPPVNVFRRLPGGAASDGAIGDGQANRMVVNIAPKEGISLLVQGKVPGSQFKIAPAELELDYLERFGGEAVEAYGPLLLDAMRGDRTLYKHRDEVEGGWRICQPFLESRPLRDGIQAYRPGSWGPPAAAELLARDGRGWHNPE
jgi:glucose-6-phosphate 1-dehydrogenase